MAVRPRPRSLALSLVLVLMAATRPGPSAPPPPLLRASADGRILVPPLPASHWRCDEWSGRRQKVPVSYVRCHQPRWGEGFALLAKEYVVRPSEAILSAEQLLGQVYKGHYESSFRQVRYRRSEPIQHQSVTGYEVELEALGPGNAPLRLIERVLVSVRRVLSLSATGAPELFQGARPEIQRWFHASRFTALDPTAQAVWL